MKRIKQIEDGNYSFKYLSLVNFIKDMPSIDAQPVVRCKDCKYRENGWCKKICKVDEDCNSYFLFVNENDYCAWGAKMDEVAK